MLVVRSCIHLFRFIISYSCIKTEFVFINPQLKKGLYKSSYHTGHQSVCQMTDYMMKGFLDRPHYVFDQLQICLCFRDRVGLGVYNVLRHWSHLVQDVGRHLTCA